MEVDWPKLGSSYSSLQMNDGWDGSHFKAFTQGWVPGLGGFERLGTGADGSFSF